MMKKIKGFTLVELIVVMAIMTIIMAALMHFMSPIRDTYVDSTLYESQRTTQSGIGQYLCESVRYATNLGIYGNSDSSVSSSVDAAKLFLEEVTGTPYVSMSAEEKELENRLQIITIDQSTSYSFGNETYTGRIIRRKVADESGATTQTVNANDEKADTTTGRLALGSAYYGSSDYTITVVPDTGNNTLTFTITSAPYSSLKANTVAVSTESSVSLKNLGITGHIYDTSHYSDSSPNSKIYIVFLLPIE